ncbi:YpsA SLOG family protein [Tuwongella immobilis]|uniref:Molybdenum carrier n=1 Tax=Tuwongella immobilis TaxID=692036 RepID=A0A6C2YIM8_9BACT|nr:putative molybdenum carrier protein [Tuwongella immobilis]VIP01380.1 Uncharacterized protein OS=Geobacter lovleyi (strain ATCC BAA-1151 / DSM 17278 / SZ) GN=Glov_0284 PE=4 SV=1: MoCo_carrier [Tuwongella immobilis]VTR98233.1 Uncharacterized protein OS=Geobacter lovleyi (strain ATCC BAA-1151 / DSM 17278 / SZ) GN=Glov_0284 PE=4 SV=1: MoCo_carrier [Tuwongella immobilis]
MLQRVISGGQTGADQAGVRVAARFGYATGGWMPRGFITLDGPNPEFAAEYHLQEHPEGYAARTWANVRDSDATIRLAGTFASSGEKCTLRAIRHYGRPHFDVLKSDPPAPDAVVDWLLAHEVRVLNIAGNAERISPLAKAHGITEFVTEYLTQVLTRYEQRLATYLLAESPPAA